MATALREITDGAGRIVEPELFRAAEPVHRQLRPHLPADYADYMARVFADGAAMVALLADGRLTALAVWRVYRNTSKGLRLYVDDLVTDEGSRSTGAGAALIAWLERRARDLGCDTLDLDSGTHRGRAHRFYFRHGFVIGSFAFSKALKTA